MTEPVFPQILRYNLPAKDNVASQGDIDCKYWIILQKTDLERYQQLLEKILAAVHLDMNQDVYLVSTDELKGFPLYTLLDKDTSDHTILIFGLTPQQLGLNLRSDRYRVRNLLGHKIIFVGALQDIQGDQQEKKQLWEILKTFVNPTS